MRRKTTAMLLASVAAFSALAGCGEAESPAETGTLPEPEATEEAAEDMEYTFAESALGGALTVEFTVKLCADGTYTITENNPAMGEMVYTGSQWEDGGSYFTTGPIETEAKPQAEWFNDDYSCLWIIKDGQAVPMNYVDGSSGGGESGTTLKNVKYASNSASQVMDIYLPEGEGPFPVIMVVHGGGFAFGDAGMAIIQPIFNATERGYAVVSVDYRKSSEAAFPAALADVKAVVRFIRANAEEYGFDSENIAAWGESAGAYLSLMTALTPAVEELNGDVSDNAEYSSAVKALVDFYGPVEFYVMDDDYASLGKESSFAAGNSFESTFLGQPIGEDKEYTYKSYWGTYTEQLPEGFALSAWIQAGDSDNKVPYLQSVTFSKRLTELLGGENVHFSIIEGADHEDAAFYTEENLATVLDFLDGVLK